MLNNNIPLVSVVIVNHNGKDFVHNCIESILKNNYNNYEIIVVDNYSMDDSVRFLKEKYSSLLNPVKIVELEKNFGPAKARNEGVKIAGGEYIGFLDNDTEVHPNWMIEAIKDFEKDKELGVIQCKLLLLKEPGKIDCVGEYIGQNGFLVQRAKYREIDNGQYDEKVEILAAKSAGMFIRRDIFNRIGGFDEDYYIYMEETDLCWRSWLSNYKVRFCPMSIVYHAYSSTKDIVDKNTNNYLIRFHGTKNYIMTIIKNLGNRQLIIILPIHIMIWTGFAIFLFIRRNFRSMFNITKGILWNAVYLPKVLRKRRNCQATRVLPDRALFRIVMRKEKIITKINQFLEGQNTIETPEN